MEGSCGTGKARQPEQTVDPVEPRCRKLCLKAASGVCSGIEQPCMVSDSKRIGERMRNGMCFCKRGG